MGDVDLVFPSEHLAGNKVLVACLAWKFALETAVFPGVIRTGITVSLLPFHLMKQEPRFLESFINSL